MHTPLYLSAARGPKRAAASLLAAGLVALAGAPARAQQPGTMPGMNAPAPADTARPNKPMAPMSGMEHAGRDMGVGGADDSATMSAATSRNLPMSRNGSATSWQPDATPMYMWMTHKGPWMVMAHGGAYGRYTSQNFNHSDGRGRAHAVDGPNWGMAMAQRNVGTHGLLNLTLMMSLDPLTETNGGYPLLFQTGESYKGQPLIDKQHPHDLVSGLSVGYTHAVSQDVDVSLYLGYPGEPAIGPVAFMHRLSAMPNPDAPLSHHWTDATHITFGVATLGVRYKQFKLEGSNFTGREPDEHRYNFDKPRADSWAARLNWNPSRELALQVSRAFIKSPEDLHPDENVTRTTASILHSHSFGDERHYLASALIWGMNEGHTPHPEHAVLAETNLTLGRPTFYGRYEFVQKDSEELGYYLQGPADEPIFSVFNVHALTLGASYRLTADDFRGPEVHVGGQLTGYVPAAALRPLYGDVPLSASVYVRLNAPWMSMSKMGGMKM